MNALNRFAAVLAVSCVLLSNIPASAAGVGAVAISDVQLRTFDLAPDDGVAAGYDIDFSQSFLSSLFWAAPTQAEQETMLDLGQAGSVRVDHGPSHVESHTNGAIGDVATAVRAQANLGDHALASGVASQFLWLTLRPYTVLAVTGHFTALSEYEVDSAKYDVFSIVTVQMSDTEGNIISRLGEYGYALAAGESHVALDKDFGIGYVNATADDLVVSLYLGAQSSINVLPLVPEPGAWMMLAAGLALLGAGTRAQGALHWLACACATSGRRSSSA